MAVPASCGELVQGTLEGRHFLVSCPVDLYARVTVALRPDGKEQYRPGYAKAVCAVRATLAFFDAAKSGFSLAVQSSIPRSKGMAVVAGAIVATALCLGESLHPEQVAQIAVSVEPSNSTMLPGLSLLDHRAGSWWEQLGPALAAELLVLDFGGEVDTLAFNRRDLRQQLTRLSERHRAALAVLRQGIAEGDMAKVGQAASASALAQQEILPKPGLEQLVERARQLGATGVCAAHSGSVVGLLFAAGQARRGHVENALQRSHPQLLQLGWYRTVGGGCRQIAKGERQDSLAGAL